MSIIIRLYGEQMHPWHVREMIPCSIDTGFWQFPVVAPLLHFRLESHGVKKYLVFLAASILDPLLYVC